MLEFNKRSDGKIRPTRDQREIILSEIRRGNSPAEVARKYGLRIQLVLKWRRDELQAPLNAMNDLPNQTNRPVDAIPASEYRRLLDENSKLRKSLANMTLDRDILKDAVDLATKKKWI